MTKDDILKLQTYKMYEGEDTVYVERDDVLKLLEQTEANKGRLYQLRAIVNGDETMPSVQSTRPKGKWTEKEVPDDNVIGEWQSAKCSACGRYHTTPYMYYFTNYNYCPSCGAEMSERI